MRSCPLLLRSLVFLMSFMGLPALASAQALIDFEIVPGAAPADKLAIDSQYLADYGVSFMLEGGGTPFLEAVGIADTGHGFYNAEFDSFDIEASGFSGRLGAYFLRFGTTTFSPTPGPVLIIAYATPVRAASAEIWDIDAATGGTNGYEQWTLTARDAQGAVLDTIVSPQGIDEFSPASLNGKPWRWAFDHPSPNIHSIAIQFTGTSSLVGLAFDNFSPSSPAPAPVPIGPWVTLVAGLLLVGLGSESLCRLRLG